MVLHGLFVKSADLDYTQKQGHFEGKLATEQRKIGKLKKSRNPRYRLGRLNFAFEYMSIDLYL